MAKIKVKNDRETVNFSNDNALISLFLNFIFTFSPFGLNRILTIINRLMAIDKFDININKSTIIITSHHIYFLSLA